MKLTKDEARILAVAIGDFKYTIAEETMRDLRCMDKLNELEDRLEEFGKDKRRTGRTSQNDWSDLIKRFASQKHR
jgi:hypothetical protein